MSPGHLGAFLCPRDPSVPSGLVVGLNAPRACRCLLISLGPFSAFLCPQGPSVPFSAPSPLQCLLVPPGPFRAFWCPKGPSVPSSAPRALRCLVVPTWPFSAFKYFQGPSLPLITPRALECPEIHLGPFSALTSPFGAFECPSDPLGAFFVPFWDSGRNGGASEANLPHRPQQCNVPGPRKAPQGAEGLKGLPGRFRPSKAHKAPESFPCAGPMHCTTRDQQSLYPFCV